jgi:hypothetical protein
MMDITRRHINRQSKAFTFNFRLFAHEFQPNIIYITEFLFYNKKLKMSISTTASTTAIHANKCTKLWPTGCVNKSVPAASFFSQYTPTDTKQYGKDGPINTKHAAGPFIFFLYLSPHKNFLLLSFLFVPATKDTKLIISFSPNAYPKMTHPESSKYLKTKKQPSCSQPLRELAAPRRLLKEIEEKPGCVGFGAKTLLPNTFNFKLVTFIPPPLLDFMVKYLQPLQQTSPCLFTANTKKERTPFSTLCRAEYKKRTSLLHDYNTRGYHE